MIFGFVKESCAVLFSGSRQRAPNSFIDIHSLSSCSLWRRSAAWPWCSSFWPPPRRRARTFFFLVSARCRVRLVASRPGGFCWCGQGLSLAFGVQVVGMLRQGARCVQRGSQGASRSSVRTLSLVQSHDAVRNHTSGTWQTVSSFPAWGEGPFQEFGTRKIAKRTAPSLMNPDSAPQPLFICPLRFL